jgi:hypothetical protein
METVLPPDPSLGRVARQFTQRVLDDWGAPEDLVDRALLVASELASNAFLHAVPPFLLNISTVGGMVRVSVHDGVGLSPALRDYGNLAATGRGLRLVALSSREWGVQAVGQGKEVWAHVSLVASTGTDLAPMQPLTDSPVPRPEALVETAAVHFLAVPVPEYLQLQEWNDAVFRECALLAVGDSGDDAVPQSLVRLARRISDHFARSRDDHREAVAAAHARGEATTDIHRTFPPGRVVAAVEAAESYLQVMEQLDRYCRSQLVLTQPPSDAVVEVRRWFVSEMRAQLVAGAAPTPYRAAANRW